MARQERPEQLAPKAHRGSRAFPVRLGQLGPRGHRERPARKERLEPLDPLVRKGRRVSLGRSD